MQLGNVYRCLLPPESHRMLPHRSFYSPPPLFSDGPELQRAVCMSQSVAHGRPAGRPDSPDEVRGKGRGLSVRGRETSGIYHFAPLKLLCDLTRLIKSVNLPKYLKTFKNSPNLLKSFHIARCLLQYIRKSLAIYKGFAATKIDGSGRIETPSRWFPHRPPSSVKIPEGQGNPYFRGVAPWRQ